MASKKPCWWWRHCSLSDSQERHSAQGNGLTDIYIRGRLQGRRPLTSTSSPTQGNSGSVYICDAPRSYCRGGACSAGLGATLRRDPTASQQYACRQWAACNKRCTRHRLLIVATSVASAAWRREAGGVGVRLPANACRPSRTRQREGGNPQPSSSHRRAVRLQQPQAAWAKFVARMGTRAIPQRMSP